MTKVVALVDAVRWVGDDGGIVEVGGSQADPNEETRSVKGQTIEVPAGEVDRLVKAGAVAKPGTAEAKEAKADSEDDGA